MGRRGAFTWPTWSSISATLGTLTPSRSISLAIADCSPPSLVWRDRINSSAALKKYLTEVELELYPSRSDDEGSSATVDDHLSADEQLTKFYGWLYPYFQEDEDSIDGEIAVSIWDLVLAPKYPVAKGFVEFASVSAISPDAESA